MKETLILLLTSGLSAFFGWFFSRKKTNAEAVGAEIDNDTKVINLWKEWAEHLKEDFEEKCNEMNKEIQRLSKRIEELETENRNHLKTIENLLTTSRGRNHK